MVSSMVEGCERKVCVLFGDFQPKLVTLFASQAMAEAFGEDFLAIGCLEDNGGIGIGFWKVEVVPKAHKISFLKKPGGGQTVAWREGRVTLHPDLGASFASLG